MYNLFSIKNKTWKDVLSLKFLILYFIFALTMMVGCSSNSKENKIQPDNIKNLSQIEALSNGKALLPDTQVLEGGQLILNVNAKYKTNVVKDITKEVKIEEEKTSLLKIIKDKDKIILTAGAAGVAKIKLSLPNTLIAKNYQITIKKDTIKSIAIKPISSEFDPKNIPEAGYSVKMQVEASYVSGQVKNITTLAKIQSNNTESIALEKATDGQSFIAKSNKVGDAIISAEYDGIKAADLSVTVVVADLIGVKIAIAKNIKEFEGLFTTRALADGELQLRAIGEYRLFDKKIVEREIAKPDLWSSSDAKVANIDQNGAIIGMVVADKEYATSDIGCSFTSKGKTLSATKPVTVLQLTKFNVIDNDFKDGFDIKKKTYQLKADGVYKDQQKKEFTFDATELVDWKVTAESASVATISNQKGSKGKLELITQNPGVELAVVTSYLNLEPKTNTGKVVDKTITSIEFQVDGKKVDAVDWNLMDNLDFKLIAKCTDDSTLDVTENATYQSDNSAVISVSNFRNILLQNGIGKANITASFNFYDTKIAINNVAKNVRVAFFSDKPKNQRLVPQQYGVDIKVEAETSDGYKILSPQLVNKISVNSKFFDVKIKDLSSSIYIVTGNNHKSSKDANIRDVSVELNIAGDEQKKYSITIPVYHISGVMYTNSDQTKHILSLYIPSEKDINVNYKWILTRDKGDSFYDNLSISSLESNVCKINSHTDSAFNITCPADALDDIYFKPLANIMQVRLTVSTTKDKYHYIYYSYLDTNNGVNKIKKCLSSNTKVDKETCIDFINDIVSTDKVAISLSNDTAGNLYFVNNNIVHKCNVDELDCNKLDIKYSDKAIMARDIFIKDDKMELLGYINGDTPSIKKFSCGLSDQICTNTQLDKQDMVYKYNKIQSGFFVTQKHFFGITSDGTKNTFFRGESDGKITNLNKDAGDETTINTDDRIITTNIIGNKVFVISEKNKVRLFDIDQHTGDLTYIDKSTYSDLDVGKRPGILNMAYYINKFYMLANNAGFNIIHVCGYENTNLKCQPLYSEQTGLFAYGIANTSIYEYKN